jgi:hypothetical protein
MQQIFGQPPLVLTRLKTKSREEGGDPKDHLKEHPKMFRALLFKTSQTLKL